MVAPRNQRVMLVDDEEGVRLSWNRLLSERGFEVSTAEDGQRAINRLTEKPVDVVVADLRMPGVDGLQLLQWIHESQPNTRFILLTGYGNDEVEKRARALGAFEYLNKPINPETLSSIIAAAAALEQKAPIAAVPSEPKTEAQLEAGQLPQMLQNIPLAAKAARVANRTTFGSWVQAAVGLILAPILGLLFVMFLPVIGFAMFFRVLAQAISKPSEVNA